MQDSGCGEAAATRPCSHTPDRPPTAPQHVAPLSSSSVPLPGHGLRLPSPVPTHVPPLGVWSWLSNSGVIPGGKKSYFRPSRYCPGRVGCLCLAVALFPGIWRSAESLAQPQLWGPGPAASGAVNQPQVGSLRGRRWPGVPCALWSSLGVADGKEGHAGSPWPSLLPDCQRWPLGLLPQCRPAPGVGGSLWLPPQALSPTPHRGSGA